MILFEKETLSVQHELINFGCKKYLNNYILKTLHKTMHSSRKKDTICLKRIIQSNFKHYFVLQLKEHSSNCYDSISSKCFNSIFKKSY